MISELVVEADRAFAAGRLDESSRLCHSILADEADNFPALLLLGVISVKGGRYEEAVSLLEKAEAVDPGSGKASLWLSRALRNLGRIEEALPPAIRAVDTTPADPATLYHLGVCYLDGRHDEEAFNCFRRLSKLDPSSAVVHHVLGLTLKALGRNSAALVSFKRAVLLAPDALPFQVSLFQTLLDESDSRGAVECARTLLKMDPGVESHLRLARALLSNNDAAGAEANLRRAEALGLADGMNAFAAGTVLQGLGRIPEAEAQFRKSIDLTPDLGLAYSALTYCRKMTETDLPVIERMEAMLADPNVPLPSLSHLHYALGKSKEDLGEYPEAIGHYDEANKLASQGQFGQRKFNRALYADRVNQTLGATNRESLKRRGEGSESDLPIFVIGMLRSGTTLVEQILSSHPDVGSAGEQGFWLHNRDALIDERAVRSLADKYVAMLGEMWPGKRRVVDKMPDNYLITPLLNAAFPSAKIIHVVRNPADTCLSIYSTINRLALDWSYDKDDIAFVYRQYLRMMEAWRALLPADAMMEVRYEDLVADTERVTREMVAFCGLPWDDACLDPQLNPRAVSTPSSWQVRQPVYSTSIDRWRRFEPWIGPFAELARG